VSAGRALEAALDAMHGLVADEEPYQIPPQFLDKVLKFLAQNGINAPKASPKVDALAQTLHDLDLDAEARAPH